MIENIEEQYAILINNIMKHIEYVKTSKSKDTLIDIVEDYAFKNGIEINFIADAINSDVYFKSFIQKDCEFHKVLETEIPDEW